MIAPCTLTVFPSLMASQGDLSIPSWATYGCAIASPKAYACKASPKRVLFGRARDNRRRLEDLISLSAIVYDVDTGASTDAMHAAFGEHWGFVNDTFSSTPDNRRRRIVLPASRDVLPDEYPRCWRHGAIKAERAGVIVDYAAKNANHIFGVPSASPFYESFELTGAVFDVDQALAEVTEVEPAIQSSVGKSTVDIATSSIERAAKYLRCLDPSISGSGGHRACFRAALAMVKGFDLDEETALILLSDEFNPRCSPKWSHKELLRKVKEASRARKASGWLANAPRKSP